MDKKMNQNKIDKTSGSDYGSECIVLVNSQKVKARILHVGRGKFKILKDEMNSKHVGKIIDAGDVIFCLI